MQWPERCIIVCKKSSRCPLHLPFKIAEQLSTALTEVQDLTTRRLSHPATVVYSSTDQNV